MEHHGGLAFVMLDSRREQDSTTAIEPANSNSSPLIPILCFHGSGTNTHYDTWLPLVQEISTSAPVLYYERRGVGASAPAGSRAQIPREAVEDLTALLQHLALKPPYVLLAHSHGGMFAREFLQQHPGQVAGMVLAETGQETPTKHDEEQYKQQVLRDKPLSVIHADSLHGRRGGTTSAAGLEMLRRWAEEDERLKKAQLRLSSNARYVHVDGCGHNVVRDRPGVVAGEVQWVLSNVTIVQRPAGLSGFSNYLEACIPCLRRGHQS